MENKSIIQRNISDVWEVSHQRRGPKHTAGMVLEPGHWRRFDPFLLMAEDWFQRGTFDLHPHRGIETVTFVIDGNLEHNDNHGGEGVLHPGDVQWMTAGRGIIHAEQPREGDTVHSLQLWINLPSFKKSAEPRYQNLKSIDMPVFSEEGVLIRVFSGSSNGIKSETLNHVPVTMVEVVLEQGAVITQDLPSSFTGFIYILEGSGVFGIDETPGEKQQALRFEQCEGHADSEMKITAKEKLHLVLFAGEPIGEPVVAQGPFVMNTQEEIIQAYADYRDGKF
jgi:redox-sensitive bicupin YhaK (pirin superfamily)